MKKALASLRILLATILITTAVIILVGQSAMAVRNDESTTPTATPLPRFTPPPVRTPTPRPGPTEVIIGPGGIAVTPVPKPAASPSTGPLDPTKGKLTININPVPVKDNLIVTDGGDFKTGPLINGTLLCPIATRTPPLHLEKGCTTFVGTPPSWASKAYGPATLRGPATDSKCDNYGRAAGQGYAFYDNTNGQCWSCPVLTHKNGIIPIDSKDPKFPACTAGNEDGIVWQSAQFPEPGVAAFADTLIVQLAFKDAGFVDAFLSKRQKASRSKDAIWSAMIDSPNDSPEFKALIFAAILAAAEKDPSYAARPGNAVSRFQDYVQKRRTYVAQDAVLMYNAYLEFNGYKVQQGVKAVMAAGGPMSFASKATGAVISSPSASLAGVMGTPPDDYVNAAYAAAVPDQRGEEFIRALVDMGGTQYNNPGGTGTTSTVDPVATAQLAINIISSATAIHDALDDLKVIKGISALGGKTGLGIGLGVGLAGTLLDGIQGAMTLVAQMQADKQYSQLLEIAAKPVNIAQIMKSGSQEDKNSLIMWWALATSGYKASSTVREFPINNADVCATYLTQCSDIKGVVMKAKPVAAPLQLPAPPELILQIDATKALAQLLSGVTNAASATAAKPQITAAVARVNQATASVKTLTGPAWGGANQHRAEIDAAIGQVKKELTRIQGLPDAYPVIQGALAPLNLASPGGRAPGP